MSFLISAATIALADRIFAEIAKVFDRQLPSATITHAPTIAALAGLLEQPTLPAFPPLVKLKAGAEKTPIFIAHGLDGRARFVELANHIRTEHAIYGFQAKGVDGLEEPFERIEEMAALLSRSARQTPACWPIHTHWLLVRRTDHSGNGATPG